LDAKGFVLTGAGKNEDRRPLETSLRGVFAIGDVRSGSVKRVAAAVGEGAQVVTALHAELNRLEHTQLIPIDPQMHPHFRDVTDHVRRVREEIDALREVLAFAFEASLMAGQEQQTAITRRLAAWAAILAIPTAIAGIYGMNFQHMPELKWAYGYYLVVGVILAICTTLYVQFRRNGWL
jgi:Mg2+ and Co2+ transporter CorA